MKTRATLILLAFAAAGCSNGSPNQGAFLPNQATAPDHATAPGVHEFAAMSPQGATTFTLAVSNVPPGMQSAELVDTPAGKPPMYTYLNVNATKDRACASSSGKIT